MSKTLIHNATIYTEQQIIENGSLLIDNEKIATITNQTISPETVDTIIDANGLTLIPGFIDSHIHGGYGVDVMDATKEALETIAVHLPQEGTTSFLATTITQSIEQITDALKNVAMFPNQAGQAEIIGVHLEGPFIEAKKAGAQPLQHILAPSIQQFTEWQEQANGLIKTITLAPELEGMKEFIQFLSNQGITISAGHTDATFKDMQLAVEQGVTQLTHLCNAMNGIHHRDVGAVGAALLLDNLVAEIIADKIHVSSAMLHILYQQITKKRLILITDAMRAKGLPDGDYELGGQAVNVTNQVATLENGTLAGSTLKMHEAVKNMIEVTGADTRDIIQMASINPAIQAKVIDRKGTIKEGKDADILLIDKEWNIHFTFCNGKLAYKR